MLGQRAYFTDLLAEIKAERAQAWCHRWYLQLCRALAVVGRQDATRRRLTVQLRVIADSLEHLRKAEAEVRALLLAEPGR